MHSRNVQKPVKSPTVLIACCASTVFAAVALLTLGAVLALTRHSDAVDDIRQAGGVCMYPHEDTLATVTEKDRIIPNSPLPLYREEIRTRPLAIHLGKDSDVTAALTAAEDLENIRELTVVGAALSANEIDSIEKIKGLDLLTLHDVPLDTVDISPLNKPGLTRLSLINNGIDDHDIVRLCRAGSLADLAELNLAYNSIADDSVSMIVSKSPVLGSLCISGTKVEGRCFEDIARHPRLQALTICDLESLNGDMIGDLASSASLRELDVSFSILSDSCAKSIAALPDIAVLRLVDVTANERFYFDIREMHSLSALVVDDNDIPSRFLPPPSLKSLSLRRAVIADEAVSRISALPRLEHLDLSESTVTDDQLERISKSEHLVDVDVSMTRVTAAGLRSLAKATALKTVTAGGCAIDAVEADEIEDLYESRGSGSRIQLITY